MIIKKSDLHYFQIIQKKQLFFILTHSYRVKAVAQQWVCICRSLCHGFAVVLTKEILKRLFHLGGFHDFYF